MASEPSADKGVEWMKKHLQALGRVMANLTCKTAAALQAVGRVMANLACKTAAALLWVTGSIASQFFSTLGKISSWIAENLWALAIAVGSLLFVSVIEGFTSPHPKRH